MQDLLSCLLLSEAVYKAAEGPPAAAAAALNRLRSALPPGLAPLQRVQFSRRAAEHRWALWVDVTQINSPGALRRHCRAHGSLQPTTARNQLPCCLDLWPRRHLLARSRTTLYVAFMGSKHPRDYLADANLLSRLLWSEAAAAGTASSSGSSGSGAAAPAAAAEGPAAGAAVAAAAVHRGFLSRARGVQVEALWAHARRQGLRLILCGHSLGAAVAQLCTLRLLHALQAVPPPLAALRCFAFGAPPIGNAALAARVRHEGWEPHFLSVALPGERWQQASCGSLDVLQACC